MFSLKNQIDENLPVVEVSRQMRGRYQSQLDVDCVFVCSNGDIKASIFAVYPSDFFRGKVETLYRNRSFPLIIDCKGMAFLYTLNKLLCVVNRQWKISLTRISKICGKNFHRFIAWY